MVLAIFTV